MSLSTASNTRLDNDETKAFHSVLQREPAILSLYSSNNLDLTLETEIERLSEDKRKAVMSATADEEAWRKSLRLQLEAELTARVREVLDSQFALKQGGAEVSQLGENVSTGILLGFARNSRSADVPAAELLSEREKQLYVPAENWKVSEMKRQIQQIMSESNKELLRPCYSKQHSTLLLNCLSQKNQNRLSDFFLTLNRKEQLLPKTRQYYAEINDRAIYDYSGLTSSERHSFFYPFTKTGFQEAMKTGKLPDGSQLVEVQPGLYRDQSGITRSKHGPFWPVDSGPLLPTPVHKHCVHKRIEPLHSSSTERSSQMMSSKYQQQQLHQQQQLPQQQLLQHRLPQQQLHQQQLNQQQLNQQQLSQQQLSQQQLNQQQLNQQQRAHYPGKWRGVIVVFDSEKSPKGYVPPPPPPSTNEGHCPSLLFESRFESGNLRQARRTGQFEYELVLSTDLYTKRHTQWYYFQVQNAQPDITYTFRIINLLKKDSLYAHGMQPLLYSEALARREDIGWTRTGHQITYTKNLQNLQCPLLTRDRNYYVLEWQMEFPSANDTCYLAHCYPYTFSDLRNDLDNFLADPERSKVMKVEVLCETKAGNSCYLATVTGDQLASEMQNNSVEKQKKVVVVTARVHPGETNSSWMMRGLLSHITGHSPSATELRKHFVFKIVPMINPDGVIVGNYRCSLSGHDLNRNYRKPNKETFPTVWHIKEMIRNLSSTNQVLVYCDLHGHSRKQNVFMYGCAADQDQYDDQYDQPLNYLRNRLFPWLMAKQSPDRFSYPGCKFHISRCKESTGRVVMYRQLGIRNSYTMEATFCGTAICQGERRHFNIQDFEEIGRIFCDVALEYRNTQENVEFESRSLHQMLKYLMEQYLLQNPVPKDIGIFTCSRDKTLRSLSGDTIDLRPLSKADERQNSDAILSSRSRLSCHLLASEFKDNDSFNDCLQLMKRLSFVQHLRQTDSSSDSDSESEPEYSPTKSRSRHHRKRKTKKRRNQNQSSLRRNNDSEEELNKVTDQLGGGDHHRPTSRENELPAISSLELNSGVRPSRKQVYYINPDQGLLRKNFIRSYPQFVSKYEGRSNGGIPCFSEERVLYRAAKRTAALQKRTGEEQKKNEENIDQMFDEYETPYNGRTDPTNTSYCICHQTILPLSVQSLISSRPALPEMWQLRLEATRQNSLDVSSGGYGPDFQCINCGLPRRIGLTSTMNQTRYIDGVLRSQQRFHPFSSVNERYNFPMSAQIPSSGNVVTSANRNRTEVGQLSLVVDTTASNTKALGNSRSCFHEPVHPEMSYCAPPKPDRKVRTLFRPEEQSSPISLSIHQLPSFRH